MSQARWPDESRPDPLLYKIADVADLLGLGQSKVYRLVRDGKLRAVRVDGVIRIPRDSLESYVAALPAVTPDEESAADAALTR